MVKIEHKMEFDCLGIVMYLTSVVVETLRLVISSIIVRNI